MLPYRISMVLLLVADFAAGALCHTAYAQTKQTLHQITAVRCRIQQTTVPTLVVTAQGAIPAGGYQQATLSRRRYVQPPADGIQEYDFTAVTPDGVTTPARKPPEATDNWPNYAQEAAWLKGMRIYGVADGIKEETLQTCLAEK
jgi:hypothetical protein